MMENRLINAIYILRLFLPLLSLKTTMYRKSNVRLRRQAQA